MERNGGFRTLFEGCQEPLALYQGRPLSAKSSATACLIPWRNKSIIYATASILRASMGPLMGPPIKASISAKSWPTWSWSLAGLTKKKSSLFLDYWRVTMGWLTGRTWSDRSGIGRTGTCLKPWPCFSVTPIKCPLRTLSSGWIATLIVSPFQGKIFAKLMRRHDHDSSYF